MSCSVVRESLIFMPVLGMPIELGSPSSRIGPFRCRKYLANRSKWGCFQLQSVSGRHDGRRIILPIAVLRSDNPADLTHIRAVALLDTGATSSAIVPRVVAELGLAPYAKRPLMVATEEWLVDYFLFRIGLFPNPDDGSDSTALPFVFAETDGFRMRDSNVFEAILGMDVISQCDLRVSRNGTWKLNFG